MGFLVLGCSSGPQRGFVPSAAGDAGAGDTPGTLDLPPLDTAAPEPCVPGQVRCAGQRVLRCDGAGVLREAERCEGATGACAPDLGCRACVPGSGRCDPARAAQTQSCAADGSRWDDGAVCSAADGASCVAGACQSRCSVAAAARSYLGCDYWPVVTANTQLAPRFPFAVVLSNPQAYEVQVQLSGGALTAPVSLRLNPGAIQTVVLPWVLPLVQLNPLNMGCRIGTICFPGNNAHSTLARGGAYHVHANGPIAAYQFNPLTYGTDDGMYYSYTNDASLLLPQSVLTRRYTVSTWPNWLRETEEGRTIEFGGFVAIAAVTGEVTTVTVRPRVDVSPGEGVPALRAGGTYRFELSQGDVLQLLGTGRGDLSGSTVEASNPVAVFVGHDCTNVPFDRVACDHLEEQLLPDETWGRDYLVSALRDRGPATPSVVRVLSRADGNALTFEPAVRPPTTLDRGRVLEFSTAQSFRVRGSEPFLVTQFMIGQGGDLSLAGDPAMVQEVPVQQFRAAYDFFVPGTYPRNFLNIVAPADAALDLDGTPARGSQESVGGLTVYYLPISAGPHRLRSTSGQFFGIKVYGVAPYTSYMYPGGLDLQLLTPG